MKNIQLEIAVTQLTVDIDPHRPNGVIATIPIQDGTYRTILGGDIVVKFDSHEHPTQITLESSLFIGHCRQPSGNIDPYVGNTIKTVDLSEKKMSGSVELSFFERLMVRPSESTQ